MHPALDFTDEKCYNENIHKKGRLVRKPSSVMNFFRRILSRSCIYSVIITLLVCLFGIGTGLSGASINILQFLLILLFGFVLALAGELFSLPHLAKNGARILHFVITYASFIILALVTGKIPTKASSVMIFTFLFIVVYIAYALWGMLIRHLLSGRTEETPAATEKKK